MLYIDVIHTVGPIGENPAKLQAAYSSSLNVAVQNKIKTVALCGISTGVYGYPLGAATHIAMVLPPLYLYDSSICLISSIYISSTLFINYLFSFFFLYV